MNIDTKLYGSVVASVFPHECKVFEGPHDQKCLQALWSSTGCANGGLKSPDRLSNQELGTLSRLDLK